MGVVISVALQFLVGLGIFFATGAIVRAVLTLIPSDPIDDGAVLIVQGFTTIGWMFEQLVSLWVGVCRAVIRARRLIEKERSRR